MFHCFSGTKRLTPGITRRDEPLISVRLAHESRAIRGRVHAVVMLRVLWKQLVIIGMRAYPEPHNSLPLI